MEVKKGDDKTSNLEKEAWFPTTKADTHPHEQSEEAHLEERERTSWRDGKELEAGWTTE